MIITQTHKRRTFVGSMNLGTDLVESLKSICVDNTIFCAQFSAVGYLEDVALRAFDAKRKRYKDPVKHAGTFHGVSITGNVSLANRQTVVQCHVIGTVHEGEAPPRLVSGELLSGKVVSIEFHLTTNDDIRLYRAEDARTGLDAWLHVEFGEGPLPRVEDERKIEVIAPTDKRRRPNKAVAVAVADDGPDELEIREGDLINHPTLGRCEVSDGDGDERWRVKLASGRTVELHLGLLELTPMPNEGERRVFKVTIKRRTRG